MEVRRRYFREPFPAATAVVVSGLANPEWLVEIEATAVLP
jgi:enamine deaminase RidA (YjgF/YER057c/UK114 family)